MNTTDEAAAWHGRADELAEWALARLANRTDRHGGYAVRDGRTGPVTAPPHGPEVGALSHARLVRHFRAAGPADVVGVHSLGPDSTGKTCDVDVDAHPGQPADLAANLAFALYLFDWLAGLGIEPLLYESNGRGGYHCRVLFDRPVPGPELFRFGRWLTSGAAACGLADRPESYPKQATLGGTKRWGNWLRVPGRHHTRDFWSRAWNGETWLAGAAAVAHLLAVRPADPRLIPFEAVVAEAERVGMAGPAAPERPRAAPAAGDRPGDAFNRSATWESILGPHGWRQARRRADGSAEWTRPNKDGGVSATTGFCRSDGKELLFSFTSNGGAIPPLKAIDKFGAHALLNHGGDFAAAARALAAAGYGPAPGRGSGWVGF